MYVSFQLIKLSVSSWFPLLNSKLRQEFSDEFSVSDCIEVLICILSATLGATN